MVERILNVAWILAAMAVLGMIAYESWHPCGLRSMYRDTGKWIERCYSSSNTESAPDEQPIT